MKKLMIATITMTCLKALAFPNIDPNASTYKLKCSARHGIRGVHDGYKPFPTLTFEKDVIVNDHKNTETRIAFQTANGERVIYEVTAHVTNDQGIEVSNLFVSFVIPRLKATVMSMNEWAHFVQPSDKGEIQSATLQLVVGNKKDAHFIPAGCSIERTLK